MRIIHVHPSYRMASRFIKPLMEKEKSLGYKTNLIAFDNCIKTKSNINFNLGLKNIFIL